MTRNTAAKLLAQASYRRRCLRKELMTGRVDAQEREQQFRFLDALRRQTQAHGNPMLSVDPKKKELLGPLHRTSQCYSTGVQPVYDHDFRHLGTGKRVPHGVYDYFDNVRFMTPGTSCESNASAIALAWLEDRRQHYPDVEEIVLTFDAGAAPTWRARSLRFEEDLIALTLSAHQGMSLHIAHYPPYTSKRHPIEHRLFCHVERALRGVILDTPKPSAKPSNSPHPNRPASQGADSR